MKFTAWRRIYRSANHNQLNRITCRWWVCSWFQQKLVETWNQFESKEQPHCPTWHILPHKPLSWFLFCKNAGNHGNPLGTQRKKSLQNRETCISSSRSHSSESDFNAAMWMALPLHRRFLGFPHGVMCWNWRNPKPRQNAYKSKDICKNGYVIDDKCWNPKQYDLCRPVSESILFLVGAWLQGSHKKKGHSEVSLDLSCACSSENLVHTSHVHEMWSNLCGKIKNLDLWQDLGACLRANGLIYEGQPPFTYQSLRFNRRKCAASQPPTSYLWIWYFSMATWLINLLRKSC